MEDLGFGRRPIVMPHYPHMLAEDVGVWTRFLESERFEIIEVWYDVHVGAPISLPPEAEDYVRAVARGVSRKRIDCVCRVGPDVWVVEVKPFANMTALGQALTYTRLFKQEYSTPGKVRAVVVCDTVDEDLVDEFEELKVLVIRNTD